MMWREEKGKLVRSFTFNDFKDALAFVDKVGNLAEAHNHHPDIELGWGKVKVVLFTHSEKAITKKDYKLAKEIDAL